MKSWYKPAAAAVLLAVLILSSACGNKTVQVGNTDSKGQADGTAPTTVTASGDAPESPVLDGTGDAALPLVPSSGDSQTEGDGSGEEEAQDPAESGAPADEESSSPSESSFSQAGAASSGIANTAAGLVGSPYTDNGANPQTGFDNSGFLYYVLAENGITISRKASGQSSAGTAVSWEEIQPGDLLFFSTEPGGSTLYGGVYLGDGKMVYAANPQDNTMETAITSPYWAQHFSTARRF